MFVTDENGNERYQLFRLEERTRRIEPVSHEPGAMHHFGGWSRDGRQIAFSANRLDPRFFDVYVRDLAMGAEESIWADQALLYPLAWAPNANALLVLKLNTYLDSDLYLFDLGTRKTTHLTAHRGEAYFVSPCFSPNGRFLYAATNLDRQFAGVFRLDLGTEEWTPVIEEAGDVEELAISGNGRYLAYIVNRGGCSELRVFSLREGSYVTLPRLPTGAYVDLTWAPDGVRLALVVDGARHPMDIWVADMNTRKVECMNQSCMAGISRETLVEPLAVRYPSFDGLEIPAWLYAPPGVSVGDRLPAIVEVHGGPELQARPRFDSSIQCLTSLGYLVLAPNVRGSSGYGRTYLHLDDRRKRWDAVADLKSGWEWLVATGWADPNRVAIWGSSYGGFMVMAAVTTYPALWAAGVNIVGFANLETHLKSTHPHRRHLREVEYGLLDEDVEWMRRVSPIHHLERITAAMMVIHGANDPLVSAGESEQIVGRLRELGREVNYQHFADEGHGLVKTHNQIRGYGSAIQFLNRVLQPDGGARAWQNRSI
jgi:dipeptidyl aminopeptidase/acylaminoacyl peptidase